MRRLAINQRLAIVALVAAALAFAVTASRPEPVPVVAPTCVWC